MKKLKTDISNRSNESHKNNKHNTTFSKIYFF